MSKYKGKNILIVGFGTSGVAVARFMAKQGANIVVSDIKQRSELNESIRQVSEIKIEYDLGRHTNKFFHTADLIVVSPGVPLNIKPLEEAREKGVAITTEVELAASALKEPLIAVTGTNGKTTVTTLIGEMLKADGRTPYVGGNIGKPLIDYFTDGHKADVVVAELSSFQIQMVERMVPAVAVFTNIGQDHLDRYADMESYIDAKKNLLKVCDRNSYVIMNHDDPVVSRFASETSGKVYWFTKKDPMSVGGEFAEQFTGAYLSSNGNEVKARVTGREETYDLTGMRLFGEHNKENVMAAVCAARTIGVSEGAIQKTIKEFQGVEHRLEFVRKKDGVYFFNDSKATNVMSVYRSLNAFKRNPIILIAGGKDKDMDFTPLADSVRSKVKILILLGEAKEKMNRTIGDASETYLVGTFEEAVLLAYQKSRSGDIILLSPGCASYDLFRNFEERGEYFKKIISQL